ncbi:MAG: PD-(D/E)XK nuclease family protein [Burkholderiaceae bacterium]|nr:PD-(D/E)XK nuclease family protein [Burkholderiaceae bacterium]
MPTLIAPTSAFWDDVARVLTGLPQRTGADLSRLRVVVPAYSHAQLLKAALARKLGSAFVPPRIVTLNGWCGLQPPESPAQAASPSARLMALYAELRQYGWLKKLFSARRNTDLLPLAQLLLDLCDELTASLLPGLWQDGEAIEARWQQALQQLTPAARHAISDEAQLVWSVWKTQLDGADPLVQYFAQTMRLARRASESLVWIAAGAPEPFEQTFLQAYGERQDVLHIAPDWRAIDVAYLRAWPELQEELDTPAGEVPYAAPRNVALCEAVSLEQEAQLAAQTIVEWLQAGKTRVAVVAQDRVAARRLRALLERARVFVTDETGWKLSTTRAASAVAAWFDLIANRGDTATLLDLLKSPFVFPESADKQAQLTTIEICLRNANVPGGWEAVGRAVAAHAAAAEMIALLAREASVYAGRKTVAQWAARTEAGLTALGAWQALQADAAGMRVAALLRQLSAESGEQEFSLAEWRAFIALQMESTSFVAPGEDKRVVMLTLSGTQLRSFDAVWMLGCDAAHLPSAAHETLFFANTVRRELGLRTRESEQRRQLRDFVSLLNSNSEVVLSWQAHHDGEPNPVSPWIERLQLTLARSEAPGLPVHGAQIAARCLPGIQSAMPAPVAPQLLPPQLSASGYNSLVACPYQFFATRMLGLSGLEEFSDMPEKRDYGDWLHQILSEFHQTLQERSVPAAQRASLLRDISETVFARETSGNAAALGYAVRWRKAMPAYLDWVERREAVGWRFAFGERKFEKAMHWDGGQVKLHGRIDRVDQSEDGERGLLDYKTRNAAALREKLKQGEDRQLAFYGILSDTSFTHAHYVPLEPMADKIDAVEASNFSRIQQQVEQQLRSNLQALAQGAALPATGIEAVCEYCAVRGLCRKGTW